MLNKLLKLVKNGIMGKLMPPTPLETPTQILERLNTIAPTNTDAPWIMADSAQALIEASLSPTVSYNVNNGWVVKTFISTKTGEVKLFLAKLLDIPERGNLWK